MQPGEKIDDFSALDQHGSTVRLSQLLVDGPVVLFFYPKASSGGCTSEACHFRDLTADFAAHGARPVGISHDTADDQAAFDQQHGLGMTLLSDPDKSIAKSFGAKRVGPVYNRRATYVISAEGVLIEEIRSERDMDVHADRALAVLAAR